MEKLALEWCLNESEAVKWVERYCHNCGRTVVFIDSLKRRNNANGKNIFEYAIFKCSNGHTWNQSIAVYKSNADRDQLDPVETKDITKLEMLEMTKCKRSGIKEIEIVLAQVTGKWRLDKLLAQQIQDLSRSKIEKGIRNGTVLLDGQIVKPSAKLKENQRIYFLIDELV